MDKSRNIYVAGNYIANQTIGTQILHADRVYTNAPDKEQPHEVEDVTFEEVGVNAPISRAAQYPFVVPEKLKELLGTLDVYGNIQAMLKAEKKRRRYGK